MSMTLEQAFDALNDTTMRLQNVAVECSNDDMADAMREKARVHARAVATVKAHLTQPAQSVAVGAEDLQIEAFPPDPGGMRVYRPRGVKVTHKPTGITVACDHERSQHANRDTALRAITAALQEKGNGSL